MSIMLAAADLGIGSAHAAVADQELARRLLGFPEDRFCAWLISLGVPADRPLAPIDRLARIRALPIRLLDRRRAPAPGLGPRRAAGWAETYDAEYLALTQLQADAFMPRAELAARVVYPGDASAGGPCPTERASP